MLFHANDLGMLCLQLRPVLIVLELAPLTLRKLKDDKKTREIQNLLYAKSSQLTPTHAPPGGWKGDSPVPKMAECLRDPPERNIPARFTHTTRRSNRRDSLLPLEVKCTCELTHREMPAHALS